MFVLRRVLNDVYVSNVIIGSSYLVYFKDEHPDDFEYFLKSKGLEKIADKIFAFVSNDDGEEHALYNNSRYYMMTSTGSTFESIKDK